MQNMMEFPNTFDEFAKEYGFTDTEQIYTNGSELIPVFRVKQWLEHITLKQEPCNDMISRQAVLEIIVDRIKNGLPQNVAISQYYRMKVEKLPPVNPQEPLTEEDYIELRDRFGEYVEFVVRDMISNKGERWKKRSDKE